MAQPQLAQLVTHDPMKRLSYDIWVECIKFAILYSAAGPLLYIGVSPEWNRALLETPSLWTTIVVENGQDELARISTFFHLSQNCLLDVIYRSPSASGILRDILAAKAQYIRSIQCGDGDDDDEDFGAILSHIDYPFPVLQVVDTGGWGIPTSFLFLCPNLTIINSNIEVVDYDRRLNNVREVYLTGVEAKDLIRVLQHSNYRVLRVNANMYAAGIDYIHDIKSWSANLNSLSTYLNSCLELLEMTITSGLFSALLLQVSFLPRLRSLFLNIILDNPAEPINPISWEGFKHVHNLSIYFRNPRHEKGNNSVMEMILEALTKDRALQSLGNISLSSNGIFCSDELLGCFLQSAINALTIQVHRIYTQRSENPIPQSDPMIMLESLDLSSLALLDYIHASHPITLELDCVLSSPINLKKRQLSFQVDKLQDYHDNLGLLDAAIQEELLHYCRTIIYKGKSLLPLITNFYTLADIDFEVAEVARHQRIMTDFLNALLCNPEACPHLHTIRMNGYPFWELLFSVMRQRLMGNTTPLKLWKVGRGGGTA